MTLPFPLFNDSAIGLSQNPYDYGMIFKDGKIDVDEFNEHGYSRDMVQEHEIEQEMDDDVQTDNGILYNAKNTCWTDITEMYFKVKKRQISAIPHNKEILLRIKFPGQYSRGGRFKDGDELTELVPSKVS